jgi:hypothetical protein
MKRRSLLLVAAWALMSLANSAAQASTVVVTASGTIAQFTMVNTGISGSTATILIVGEPNNNSFMNSVNGANVPNEPATANGPITMFVTATGPNSYSLALMPATYTGTIGGTPGSQAMLAFNQTTGATISSLPFFFNSSGAITAVTANLNPTYDFSNFDNGKGTLNFTYTATDFLGATSFDTLFATVGATATGNGAFSLLSAAIPEPASLALLGIGVAGIVAMRRIFGKRSKVG